MAFGRTEEVSQLVRSNLAQGFQRLSS